MRIVLIIALALPLCCLAQDLAQACTIEQLEKPSYPPLARMAKETGTVEASATVADDGSLYSVLVVGKPILKSEIQALFARGRFDKTCAGQSVTFRYQFLLKGEEDNTPHTVVRHESPSSVVVQSNPTGIICILRDGGKPSWIRRVFRR